MNYLHLYEQIANSNCIRAVSRTNCFHVLREVEKLGLKTNLVWIKALRHRYASKVHYYLLIEEINFCTNSGMGRTRIPLSITRNVVLTITQLEWLVATYTTFDRITGGKTSKI